MKAGVTAAVTPALSLGFCGAKSDARFNRGHNDIEMLQFQQRKQEAETGLI